MRSFFEAFGAVFVLLGWLIALPILCVVVAR